MGKKIVMNMNLECILNYSTGTILDYYYEFCIFFCNLYLGWLILYSSWLLYMYLYLYRNFWSSLMSLSSSCSCQMVTQNFFYYINILQKEDSSWNKWQFKDMEIYAKTKTMIRGIRIYNWIFSNVALKWIKSWWKNQFFCTTMD